MQSYHHNHARHLNQLARDYPAQQHVIEQFARDNALPDPRGSLRNDRCASQPATPAGNAPTQRQGAVAGFYRRPAWLPTPDEHSPSSANIEGLRPPTPELESRETATTLPPSEDHDSTTAMRHTGAPLQGAELIAAMIARRQALALTQAEFAARLGISLRTLQEWEQGRRRPSGPAEAMLRWQL